MSYHDQWCGGMWCCGCGWGSCGVVLALWFGTVFLQMIKFTARRFAALVHYPLPSWPSSVTGPWAFTCRERRGCLFKLSIFLLLKNNRVAISEDCEHFHCLCGFIVQCRLKPCTCMETIMAASTENSEQYKDPKKVTSIIDTDISMYNICSQVLERVEKGSSTYY